MCGVDFTKDGDVYDGGFVAGADVLGRVLVAHMGRQDKKTKKWEVPAEGSLGNEVNEAANRAVICSATRFASWGKETDSRGKESLLVTLGGPD